MGIEARAVKEDHEEEEVTVRVEADVAVTDEVGAMVGFEDVAVEGTTTKTTPQVPSTPLPSI